MYAAPPAIDAEVFTELPARLRKLGTASAWADANKHGAHLHSFLEGPSFDRDGNLYVVDIPWGRIFRISPAGEWEVFVEYDGWPNGLKIHRDGSLYVADYRNGVLRIDPHTRAIAPVVTHFRTEGLKGVNDLVFAGNGDLYFTDQGQTGVHDPSGRVFRLSADGRLACLCDHVPSPNGIVLDRAERNLFVATRENAIWAFPLLADGTTSKVRVYVQMSGGGGPDGLALDDEGGLAVCHAGLGSVWLFSRLGEPVLRIRSCRGVSTTNLAYGGADRRTLFVTESETGSILTARLEVPGRTMFSHHE